MNLGKSIIGCLCLAVVILFVGRGEVSLRAFIALALSGLLGIAVGDTLYFMSLMQLGPRLSSLMGTLTPVITAILAILILGERLSLLACGGVFLTLSGVAWVVSERIPQKGIIKNKPLGVKYGLLSILCTSAGIILAKIGVSSASAITATFIRMFWAAIGLIIWGSVRRQLKGWIAPFRDINLLKRVFSIVIISVFGGFWLFLLSIKYIDASIASTLNSTTPIFVLPLSMIFLSERLSLRAVAGAFICVIGIVLLFY